MKSVKVTVITGSQRKRQRSVDSEVTWLEFPRRYSGTRTAASATLATEVNGSPVSLVLSEDTLRQFARLRFQEHTADHITRLRDSAAIALNEGNEALATQNTNILAGMLYAHAYEDAFSQPSIKIEDAHNRASQMVTDRAEIILKAEQGVQDMFKRINETRQIEPEDDALDFKEPGEPGNKKSPTP